MEGIYAISDPFHMRTWKRTGNEGTLGKRGRKNAFEKRVKLGGGRRIGKGTEGRWRTRKDRQAHTTLEGTLCVARNALRQTVL